MDKHGGQAGRTRHASAHLRPSSVAGLVAVDRGHLDARLRRHAGEEIPGRRGDDRPVGRFIDFSATDNQFAVLVDNREGDNQGVVLQHPLFNKLLATAGKAARPI